LWRDGQGRVACAIDLCPHRGVALSAGKVTGDCVECPFHGFRYVSRLKTSCPMEAHDIVTRVN